MIHINEYLLRKKTKYKGRPSIESSAESTIDELEDILLRSISAFQRPQYKTLFDSLREKKDNGYTEAMCSKLIELYNNDYEYMLQSNDGFKTADENFKGFKINSRWWRNEEIIVIIYNVNEEVQLYINFLPYHFTIRTGNMPDKDKLLELVKGTRGATFSPVYSGDYDESKLNDFKEKLDELII